MKMALRYSACLLQAGVGNLPTGEGLLNY